MPTPLVLVGDGPQENSGLGRILRDLGRLILRSGLDVELIGVGGPIPPVWKEWPQFPIDEQLHRGQDWGASYVTQIYRSYFGNRPGIVWVIWDPSRMAYYQDLPLPVQKWAYAAVDATNGAGSLGGPAAQALARFDRVLAYGRWGSEVIRTVRGSAVPYLPHGITPITTGPAGDEWVDEQLGAYVRKDDLVIGAVATNQPRKDLGLFFQTLHHLQERGIRAYGWLHTDVLVKAWAIVQLVEDCGLARRVTVSTTDYADVELAALYRRCAVTIAPGLGEGFGYPIVESLAAGTPVVHGDFGGGRELIPKREWRFPVREVRLEGIYALQRPVFRADDVANAVERALQWVQDEPAAADYCRGAVAHLNWEVLGARWLSWIRGGL